MTTSSPTPADPPPDSPIGDRDAVDLEPALQQVALLGQTGQLEVAIAQCQAILQHYPDSARAWDLLGLIQLQQGQPNTALRSIQRAINLSPEQAEFYDHAGVVYCNQQNYEAGIACYQQALRRKPQAHHTRYNLGLALQKSGRSEEAMQTYFELITQQPHAGAHCQLGLIGYHQQRYGAAIEHYQRAVHLQPNYAEAWYNLGVLYQEIGELSQALAAYQQALAAHPSYPEALNGMGTLLEKEGRATAALEHYQRALAVRSTYLPALINLGNGYGRLERWHEAATVYRQILQLDPQQIPALEAWVKLQRRSCDWAGLADPTTQLMQLVAARLQERRPCELSPFSALFLPFSAAEQLAIAQSHAQTIAQRMADARQRLADSASPASLQPDRRLRLGYVSGDFRCHAVADLMLRLFELHDRRQFEVIAYSLGPDDGSEVRQKIQQDCDCFRDLQLVSPLTAAQQIQQDHIDILVDLAGYTDYGLPELFALRSAPLQVNYLGYPGTLGADYMDYILTDAIVSPPESAIHLQETCAYLPGSYQINNNQQFIPPLSLPPSPNPSDTGSEPSPGLSAEKSSGGSSSDRPFLFCCFNKSQKLHPELFAVWMRILQQVPHSVLWLLSDHPDLITHLSSTAVAQGVAADRLQFFPRASKADHLTRLATADLFLDTWPYNAHVTASDALWAGVPVLTVPGETFASRVAASLLTAAQLPELIVSTIADYERLAVTLATQPDRIDRYKHHLITQRHQLPLFDTPSTVRHLETAYRLMWQRHCAGLPPAPLWVESASEAEPVEAETRSIRPLEHLAPALPDCGDRPPSSIAAAIAPSDSNPFPANRAPSPPLLSHPLPSHPLPSPRLAPNPVSPIVSSAVRSPFLSPSPASSPADTITCTIDAGFGQWLSQANGSLLLTTYQAGKVILIGWDGQQVTLLPRHFPKPMGIALQGAQLALATQSDVWLFANAPVLAADYPTVSGSPQPAAAYDALYLPRTSYFTGDLQIHDLAYANAELWMVNTRFSCLAQLSSDHSFIPRWHPRFISELTPEDRCHLNGLAIVQGHPRYVTALGTTDHPRGWKGDRLTGGVVIDVLTQEILLRDLCMPHSPRWHQDRLWLLNSGKGELLSFDPILDDRQVICTLPGFGRGLSLVGDYGLVGLSQAREQRTFGELPLSQSFDRLVCGVALVKLATGTVVGQLTFTTGCQELYDIAFLPAIRRPMLLNRDRASNHQAITTPEFAYWLQRG